MTRGDRELVRLRSSVVEAHRARHAAAADIQRAYLRFSWGRRTAPRRLLLVRWVLAGVAIGFGVASAATIMQPPKIKRAPPADSANVASEAAKRARAGKSIRNAPVEDPPSVLAPTEASSERQPVPIAVAGSALHSLPHAPAPALPSAARRATASDWQRAAAALRGGDLPTAEAALAELESSDSSRDRQAAELARAQVLVRRGRVAEAVPTLQRLAREGNSPVIRTQAATLLKSLSE
jgi:hypothetical protein